MLINESEFYFINHENDLIEHNDIKINPKYHLGNLIKLVNNSAKIHQDNSTFVISEEDLNYMIEWEQTREKMNIVTLAYQTDTLKWFYEIYNKKENKNLWVSEYALKTALPTYKPKNFIYEHMNSFTDFLLENTDLIFFIITHQLEDVLYNIQTNKIAVRILNSAAEPSEKKKVTLLDLNEEETDKWWFVNSVKVHQYLLDIDANPEKLTSILTRKHDIRESHKSLAKIGRIINKLYPGEFQPADIEKFVNLYKKEFQKKFDLIEIVKGYEINKWYNYINYNSEYSSSELMNSCMSPSERNDYMDLYAINDDKISMVILYSDENRDKIDARSILWKPDIIDGEKNIKGRLFMDRIYFNKQDHKNLLQKYAENNNWYYKSSNNSSIDGLISNSENKKTDKTKFVLNNIKIPLNKKFPYADTLAVFDIDTKTLTNDENMFKKPGYLSSTGGKIDGMVWLNDYNKFFHSTDVINAIGSNGRVTIPKIDTVYLPYYDLFYTKELIKSSELVEVQNPGEIGPNHKSYQIFKSDAKYSSFKERYYHRDKVKYSGFLDEYIPVDIATWVPSMESFMPIQDLVYVIINIKEDTMGKYYKREYYHIDDPSEPYFKHTDGEYYLNDLKNKLNKNENN